MIGLPFWSDWWLIVAGPPTPRRDGWLRRGVLAGGMLVAGLAAALPVRAQAPRTETIVLVRHGEKPDAGLGQLSCQGLNRALALPQVLTRDFGHPDAIFAPDPAQPKRDLGVDYDYVRPLATIEPTAIAAGLPVDASMGVTQLDRLQRALEAPERHGAVVFVAWEHRAIVTLARALLASHGAGATVVPDWPGSEFDRIYVVRLRWTGQTASAGFAMQAQGLNGRSTVCPG